MVNSLKRKLLENRLTVGSWITIGHPSVVEVMARAGFDWLTVDLEHSVIDFQAAQVLIATIQAQGLVALVRVTENQPKIIQRVMDAGAAGVIVPMVNSKAEAVCAVEAVRYPPAGKRGVGLARAQGYGFGFEEYAAKINQESVVIAQIEHIKGVTNLEEILAVEGIDGVLVGPYDLSGSLGHPGRFDHPEVLEAVQRIETVCLAKRRALGFHVIQPQRRLLEERIQKGYTFLAFSLDTLFLGTACADALRGLDRSSRTE